MIGTQYNAKARRALDWWAKHNYALEHYWEYNHRRKFGEPSLEDYEQFEAQARATKATLAGGPSAPQPFGNSEELNRPKPNYVPMQRDVVRDAGGDPASVRDTTGAAEVAENGPAETESEVMPDGEPVSDTTQPPLAGGSGPPEPPPVQGLEDYGVTASR